MLKAELSLSARRTLGAEGTWQEHAVGASPDDDFTVLPGFQSGVCEEYPKKQKSLQTQRKHLLPWPLLELLRPSWGWQFSALHS